MGNISGLFFGRLDLVYKVLARVEGLARLEGLARVAGLARAAEI